MDANVAVCLCGIFFIRFSVVRRDRAHEARTSRKERTR